ncbi:hypothetical protein [Deinococcus soli (ex Cha et al. 2016)]|uniref:Uncharacterized protein n=2 Tax=Deinococcus soli (ex Cha et al. 2016) TaxID=1309411 RepID=A0AAE3XJ49_9DEIO|nr:hypothetical protein [Deinococcus soli (ex Cha et al. 2016)]MDR6221454.1 hypothetical protein [Deinococcus soli (ex Cha et al. 2016)]MDR6331444.1 hypothetical protein [Deinococcus soli (ex Cha et al. 2016)]MDR6754605.1 hypothetical protein [Deinococcus soli (ex Cha et al. 2016)]
MSTEQIRVEDARDDLPFQIHWELDDAPLSVDAFRVYAHFVRRAGRDGLVHPAYQSIGETCFRATMGATAHPRSLRNRAMKAVRELEAAGLVIKKTRTRLGKAESDTNVYVLTPKRQWLADMQRRGTELQGTLQAARAEMAAGHEIEARRVRGGIPTMPPSIPTMPRGIPTMPKVSSSEVSSTEEEKEKKVTGGQSEPDARFSSPSGEEPKTKAPRESGSDQAAPRVEHQAPTPGSFQEGNVEGGREHSSATEVQQVPPAAADSVDARLDELLNRRWLNDYTVRGERKRALIDEPTKSGIRRRDVARDITLDTLEDLIRSARSERRQLEARAKLDPSVTVPAIATLILRTVEQRMHDIEIVREAAHAHREASEAPAAPVSTREGAVDSEDAPRTPERDRLSIGSQWRRRTDGQLLTVKTTSAREIQFEDGTRVTGFKVRVDFEHIGWVD